MIPGVSRSGATILGAMSLGIDRKTAAEFSFFLAVPTLTGATVLQLAKHWDEIPSGQLGWIGLGSLVSFVVAFIVIKGFLDHHHPLRLRTVRLVPDRGRGSRPGLAFRALVPRSILARVFAGDDMKTRLSFLALLAASIASPVIAAPAADRARRRRPGAAGARGAGRGVAVARRDLRADGRFDVRRQGRPDRHGPRHAPGRSDGDVRRGDGRAEGKPAPEAKEEPEPPSPTIREMLIAEDPHFEERMRITVKVVGDEVRRIAKPIEPKFREGLSKSIARRFTRAQLEPIAVFFETDPGRAYAAQSMTLFIDKDVMLAMIQSVPGDDQGNASGV